MLAMSASNKVNSAPYCPSFVTHHLCFFASKLRSPRTRLRQTDWGRFLQPSLRCFSLVALVFEQPEFHALKVCRAHWGISTLLNSLCVLILGITAI